MDNDNLDDKAIVTKSIEIYASADEVWLYLTDINYLKKWMSAGDPEIITDWFVGSPFIILDNINGKHEYRGEALQLEPTKTLIYNTWSKINKLRYKVENYIITEFRLSASIFKTY